MTTTPITPDQMRKQADKMLATADWIRGEIPDLAEEMEDGLIALRAAADQLEAVADRNRIGSAIGEVLFNASNYPRSAMPHMLGQDIEPLRAKVTDAVLARLTTLTIPAGLCGTGGCVFKTGHESEHSWGGAS